MKDTLISIFKELYKSKDVPYIVTLEKSLNRIKNGKSKEYIEYLRRLSHEDYQLKKTKLPCICFNGEFKERSKSGLVKHSGLMVVDFDKYPDRKVMIKHLSELKNNNHFVSLFISPSDKGIKGVVKIPKCDAITHERYFKAFKREFDYEYFDESNCNVDRVCFESWDPNIYINYEADIFNPVLIDEGFTVFEKTPLLPLENESDIIDKIMAFKCKKDFIDGEINSFIFDLSGAFCEYGISQATCEGYILNYVVIGDFSIQEAKTAIKSSYKKRSFDSKYFENYNKIERIKLDIKKGKNEVISTYNISEDVFEEIKNDFEADDFWFISEKKKITISPLKYKMFLERNGFKKYFANDTEKPSFVYINSNQVEITSTAKIKDFVLDYLIYRNELDVWNYCANYQNLFSEQFLLMLESIELLMLTDTRSTSYIAFKNGILTIKSDEIKLIDFIDVDGYIWKSHILDRNWNEINEYENDYSKFIYNISDEKPFAIECTIGYLLSTYKNRSNNKAVILNDEIISDNPEGGTGKGLFVQGLSQIRKTNIIDGKQFDSKKSFAYQTVALDTKILVFDDVKKNFEFEDKFSLVTEGITLERKNKDAIKLNVSESPKIVLSTNYAIKGEGNSHDRRRHEIEIAQYYGSKLTPDNEFGRQLFDEWDYIEYNKFDNYMVYCIQSFLQNGLIEQNAKNIKLRKFIAETAMEFYEWIEEFENFPLNKRNDRIEYYEKFLSEYKDFVKWLQRKRFNIWVKKYANYKGYEFNSDSTNGKRWFEINDGKGTKEEEIEF
jgi:hypothetical protein